MADTLGDNEELLKAVQWAKPASRRAPKTPQASPMLQPPHPSHIAESWIFIVTPGDMSRKQKKQPEEKNG